jgi:hypothetical protein
MHHWPVAITVNAGGMERWKAIQVFADLGDAAFRQTTQTAAVSSRAG